MAVDRPLPRRSISKLLTFNVLQAFVEKIELTEVLTNKLITISAKVMAIRVVEVTETFDEE
jgi:hypothetical protein